MLWADNSIHHSPFSQRLKSEAETWEDSRRIVDVSEPILVISDPTPGELKNDVTVSSGI